MTNSYKYGAFRCTEHPNNTLAREPTDRAGRLRDRHEPARLPAQEPEHDGQSRHQACRSATPGMRECLEQAAAAAGWTQKWHAPKAREVRPGVFHGIGLAAHSCSTAAAARRRPAMVIINSDGTMHGQLGRQRGRLGRAHADGHDRRRGRSGCRSTQVRITHDVDTDFTADTGNTSGSRQTNYRWLGHVRGGAATPSTQLLDWARAQVRRRRATGQPAETISVTADDLDIAKGDSRHEGRPDRRRCPLADVVSFRGNPIIGQGAHVHETTLASACAGRPASPRSRSTPSTGSIQVLHYVAAHDVGKAINPFGARAADRGRRDHGHRRGADRDAAARQGDRAPAQPEPARLQGRCRIKDAPDKIEVVMVEKPKDYGVFGAHGIGEPPIASPAPADRNAVYNAVGVWVEDIPLTRAEAARRPEERIVREERDERFRTLRADHGARGGRPAGPVRRQRQGRSPAAATWSAAS